MHTILHKFLSYSFLFLILVATLPGIALKYYSLSKDKHITIFVHGTILPGFALLNPYKSYTQTLAETDLYIQCMKKIRSNPLMYEDCLMLQEGLHKIPINLIKKYTQQALTPSYSKKGAYQIIGGYDLIHTFLSTNDKKDDQYTQQEYYTFGFSGLLSNTHRQQASQELYKELITIIKEEKARGYTIHISLICYSHGGNVALYLPFAQKEYNQNTTNNLPKNITIYELVLYGTPIQEETARYAKDIMFNRILNIYSEGDSIQTRDTFSTASRKSYQQLSSYIDISQYSHILDARILAENNSTLFGHLHFWCLNKYTKPIFWDTDTKAQAVIAALNPLPLVILTPLFISLTDKAHAHHKNINSFDISLRAENNTFIACLLPHKEDIILSETSDINPLTSKIQDYALKSWYPYASSSEVVRTGLGLWSAVHYLCGFE